MRVEELELNLFDFVKKHDICDLFRFQRAYEKLERLEKIEIDEQIFLVSRELQIGTKEEVMIYFADYWKKTKSWQRIKKIDLFHTERYKSFRYSQT